MKKLLFLILFPISFYAQNDTVSIPKPKLSVIGLDKMNVVYRGISNPILIAVNDAKSFKISGDGVFLNEDGKYVIKPGTGTETKVFVEIEKLDGTKIVEEHIFRIKGLSGITGTLNGKIGEVFLRKNEINDVIISTEMIEFLFEINPNFFKVNSFDIKFSENKTIKIVGNKFDKEAIDEISNLKKGDIFEISYIDYGPPIDGLKKRAFPIIVIMGD